MVSRGTAVVLLLASLVALTACTDRASDDSTPSPTPSASYRRGEIRPGAVHDLCSAVSTRTRRSLRVDHAALRFYGATGSSNGRCSWTEPDEHGNIQVTRKLSVSYEVYPPGDHSATDEAGYRFKRPEGWLWRGWAGRRAAPLPHLGDEAELTRSLELGQKDSRTWVAVRVRNVIVVARSTMTSVLPPGHGKLPPYGAVEAGTVAAAGEAAVALHAAPTPAPSPSPTYADGEIRRVHDVCRSVDRDGARLAPGVTRRDISTAGGSSAGGCTWWENSGGDPELTVQVEVVPAGHGTGESAVQVAKTLYDGNEGTVLRGRRGMGDEAKTRYRQSGTFRSVGVLVRKGNLLVDVEYGRWQRPRKAVLEHDAAGVAAHVLAGYA